MYILTVDRDLVRYNNCEAFSFIGLVVAFSFGPQRELDKENFSCTKFNLCETTRCMSAKQTFVVAGNLSWLELLRDS